LLILDVDEQESKELANQVPPAFRPITLDQDALRFYRNATATIKSSDGWRGFLDNLENQSPLSEKDNREA
jgi:hypothetical protein